MDRRDVLRILSFGVVILTARGSLPSVLRPRLNTNNPEDFTLRHFNWHDDPECRALMTELPAVRTGSIDTNLMAFITDVHYSYPADRRTCGEDSIRYLENGWRLNSAISALNQAGIRYLLNLGDLIHSDHSDNESLLLLSSEERRCNCLADVTRVHEILAGFQGRVEHVLGDQDLQRLSTVDYLEPLGVNPQEYSLQTGYNRAFEIDGQQVIALDPFWKTNDFSRNEGPHFSSVLDSYMTPLCLEWLADTLSGKSEVIVLSHLRLDHDLLGKRIANSTEVRAVLERSGAVSAVVQGHAYRADQQRINGINYFTLREFDHTGRFFSANIHGEQ